MQYKKSTIVSLRKTIHPLLILSLFLNILAWFPTQVARAAAPIKVNSALDSLASDGKCTLREAIVAANKNAPSGNKKGECTAGSGADIIEIPAGMLVVLTRTDNGSEDSSATGDLDIIGDLTIKATGPGVVIRGASGYTDHIIQVHTGNATISGLTIMGGASGVDGGAIHNKAALTVENTTITGNAASGKGGGIYNSTTGMLTVRNSTISGNSSLMSGGGLYNEGTVNLNNLTITANQASLGGGGIAAQVGTLVIWNSIIAGNIATNATNTMPDCAAALTSAGYNLIGDSTGCTYNEGAPGILSDINLTLSALQNNGGNTQTHALVDGSPAIDAANPEVPGSGSNACAIIDQRGAYRPRGAACDIGAFEAGKPNSSVLIRAFSAAASSGGGTTTAVGRLTSSANLTFKIQFYTSSICNPATGGTAVGSPISVTTDSGGDVFFNKAITTYVPQGQFLWAVTLDPNGNASEPSRCVRVGAGNDSWPNALRIYPDNIAANYTVDLNEYLDLPGQSRWYKFTAQPNSKLMLTLTGMPENYDLTLYKDISQAFKSLTTPADLLRLGAEFAPEAFSPEAFSPEAFSPEAFSPEAFSPEAFSPEAFSPEAFSPEAFSPEAFSPEAFSPEAFSADAYSPEAFSPEAFSPEAFSPEAFSPEAFSPEAFSSAQSRSLIAISAFNGLVGEGLMVNTWDSTGDFYVRVRGRNGAFSSETSFHLMVRQIPGQCGNVSSMFPASTITPSGPNFQTLILTNLAGMEGSPEEKAALASRLEALKVRTEVQGTILDFSQDTRYQAARTQAVQNPTCPFAMNLVAGTVKDAVDAYWRVNPNLKYLVIVGNDEVIPFFRHADHSLLGNEKNYVPPVRDNTASQASLKLGYVLSQDDYGARIEVSLKEDSIPLPELAVGRLVETAAEATGMLDAYLTTPSGVVDTPASAFVSGYDFLDDVATEVQAELQAGISTDGSDVVDSLISARGISPADPSSWSAEELRSSLLGQSHDLIFLAGHFSANGALAADFTTRMQTSELIASTVDLRNALVFSVGCHSGYNIVNSHGVPLVTREPDWAQAFARKQATLIAGTGYQYGDTDFIRYSEKLYLEFTRELRVGTGPVSIGEALVKAKQSYLANTPYLRGIDEKAVLEATLFGLPMLSIDMPGARLAQTGKDPSVSGTTPYPGAKLGLDYSDLNLTIGTQDLTPVTVDLVNVENPALTNMATYYLGADGAASGPNEPVLPLFQYNVSVPGKVMRGVGFRSGTYSDLDGMLPFTGAPATEIRGVHTSFQSNYFFPVQTWLTNYFSALTGGDTLLNVFPIQYRSISPTSTLSTQRKYDALGYRLFYSSNIATYGTGNSQSTPALAAAPSIIQVSSQVANDTVHFQIQVAGNPAAGVEGVWVTYTSLSGSLYGAWQSLDLSQNQINSTLWEGDLTLNGVPAGDIRFVVQGVNGVGLVSMDTNQGSFHIPGTKQSIGEATALSIEANPATNAIPVTGRYADKISFRARLTSAGTPMAGKAVAFILGPQSRLGITDANGLATVTLSIYGLPGPNDLRVSFAGDSTYQPAVATNPFTVERQFTQISLSSQLASGYPEDEVLITATLRDVTGRYLGEETLFFILQGEGLTYYEAVITNYLGKATLGKLPLPPGSYSVKVYYSGIVPLSEIITLTDERYEPASYLSGSLTLINRPPVAANNLYQIDEDGTLTVPVPGVLSNDSDPESVPLSASLLSGTTHGTLTFSQDGSFTYQPQANFNGSDAFTYQASDGQDASPATVTIQVIAVNDAPAAFADSYSVQEDEVLLIAAPGVLVNDTDIENDTLSAALVSGPLHGSLALNQNGSFIYIPEPNFNGSDSFTYQASDGKLVSAPVLVSIQVAPVNDAPSCENALPSPDSLWTPNNQLVRVEIVNLTDPEGNPFTLKIDSIFQDELVGSVPDAYIYGSYADVRAERDGNGNGRVYHLFFTVTDTFGARCTDELVLGVVPHDQSGSLAPIDGGPLYDSTKPN
jgi:CSLREA domain-containing protein